MSFFPTAINPQHLLASGQVWSFQTTTPFLGPHSALPEVALGLPPVTPWMTNVADHQDFEPFDAAALPSNDWVPARGPSQEEWDEHRETITDLYSKKGKTLPQVMKHMKDEHNFDASIKMYKIRIKRWQLDKKFKRHEVIAILALQAHHRANGGSPTFTLRGKQVDQPALERYAKRAHITARDWLGLEPVDAHRMAPDLICQFEARIVPATKAPDELNHTESVLKSVRDYLAGAIDSPICWVDSNGYLEWKTPGSYVAFDLFDLFLALSVEKYQDNMFPEAGVCWRNAFVELESIIHSQDPSIHLALAIEIHYYGVQLPDEIFPALRRHCRNLISNRLRENTPQKSLAWNLCHIDPSHSTEILLACGAVLSHAVSPHVSQEGLIDFVGSALWGRLSTGSDHAPPFIADAMEAVEWAENIKQMIDLSPNVLGLRLDYLYRLDRTTECRELCHSILSFVSNEPPDQSLSWLVGQCMNNQAWIECGDGHFSKGKHWAIELLKHEEEVEILYNRKIYTDSSRHDSYNMLDWISNHSDIADGNQEWRQKIDAIEKKWEDELVAEVGELSLERVAELN